MDEITGEVPLKIYAERLLQTTFILLVCFEVVEWHQTDRKAKQFGFAQGVPEASVDIGPNYDHVLRGRAGTNWEITHAWWIG